MPLIFNTRASHCATAIYYTSKLLCHCYLMQEQAIVSLAVVPLLFTRASRCATAIHKSTPLCHCYFIQEQAIVPLLFITRASCCATAIHKSKPLCHCYSQEQAIVPLWITKVLSRCAADLTQEQTIVFVLVLLWWLYIGIWSYIFIRLFINSLFYTFFPNLYVLLLIPLTF